MIDFATAYPNSRKVYEDRTARLTADGPETTLHVPTREVALGGGEPSLRLYDTSGPQGHDVRAGLPKLRAEWIAARLPDAPLLWEDNAGHLLAEDAPARLLAEILAQPHVR